MQSLERKLLNVTVEGQESIGDFQHHRAHARRVEPATDVAPLVFEMPAAALVSLLGLRGNQMVTKLGVPVIPIAVTCVMQRK